MNDCSANLTAGAAAPERYRPQHHFTPRRNWMNDPNGLVYLEGEYHLFYQYNPRGIDWGHMSWGHAVSTDLLDWHELPVAIPETDQMIFSGSALIDWNNVSGLGDGRTPLMLAFFTAHDERARRQTQHLAYSRDRGRTFTHYAGNPIIDLGLEHFRDPKIFYHEESAAWIMVVALPRAHQVQFYRSTDLLQWRLAGAFGPAGATGGQWECPDLVRLPLESAPDRHFWVLKVDVDDHFVSGGSGAQYFVGQFDGTQFLVDPQRGAAGGEMVDVGPDFYAAISWSDLPHDRPGPVWIGWMSNHQTGRFYPTYPWRGAQSLARTLFLFEEEGMIRLGQRPISPREPSEDGGGGAFPLRVHLSGAKDRCALSLVDGEDRLLGIRFDAASNSLAFRRYRVGESLPPAFDCAIETQVAAPAGVTLDIHFDASLVEIFVDGGRRVYSAALFPSATPRVVVGGAAGSARSGGRAKR